MKDKKFELAYFLSRYGVDGPPEEFDEYNARTWSHCIGLFYNTLSRANQDFDSFFNSIKVLRDKFDASFENGRKGFSMRALSDEAKRVLQYCDDVPRNVLWQRLALHIDPTSVLDLSNIENSKLLDFMRGVFLQEEKVKKAKKALAAKKNIILQGPPGTGKTYIAKRLAYALMEEEAKDRVEVVQFHQSYSYEDFIQGFRPKEGGGFERRDGVFFRFCDKARRDPGRDYFFLIDEINRGNLSKIFGELMMLIEADKRGESNRVQLTYSKEGEDFSIPENVHIIGTMNTADRSLAMVDYALRRRFSFFHMPPQFNDKFEAYLQEEHSISASMVKRIVAKLTALNETIEGDDNLGDGFEIGHSYFCTDVPKGSDEETWYTHIVDHEIGPQLLEYWFDDKKKAQAQIELLKA